LFFLKEKKKVNGIKLLEQYLMMMMMKAVPVC